MHRLDDVTSSVGSQKEVPVSKVSLLLSGMKEEKQGFSFVQILAKPGRFFYTGYLYIFFEISS